MELNPQQILFLETLIRNRTISKKGYPLLYSHLDLFSYLQTWSLQTFINTYPSKWKVFLSMVTWKDHFVVYLYFVIVISLEHTSNSVIKSCNLIEQWKVLNLIVIENYVKLSFIVIIMIRHLLSVITMVRHILFTFTIILGSSNRITKTNSKI